MRRISMSICALLVLVGCGTEGVAVEPTPASIQPVYTEQVEEIELTQEEKFRADSIWLVEEMEAAHIVFGLPEEYRIQFLSEDYEQIRDRFLEVAPYSKDLRDFAFEVERYIAGIGDPHESRHVLFGNNLTDGRVINMEVMETEAGVIWVNNERNNPKIISIGGVEIEEIIRTIDEYFVFYNSSARGHGLPFLIRLVDVHERVGVSSGARVTVEVEQDGEIIEVEAIYTGFTRRSLPLGWAVQNIEHTYIEDNIFYIRLHSFDYHQPFHDRTLEAIERAIEEGTRDFIIDLRGNGGGISSVGLGLLEPMGLVANGMYGGVVRMSPRYRERHLSYLLEHSPESAGVIALSEMEDGEILFFGSFGGTPEIEIENRYGVNLVILTDSGSISASVGMGAQLQDSGLATIIGEAGGSAPAGLGVMLPDTMPHTGLNIRFAVHFFVRGDDTASERYLEPDIWVESFYALDRAVAFLKQGGAYAD